MKLVNANYEIISKFRQDPLAYSLFIFIFARQHTIINACRTRYRFTNSARLFVRQKNAGTVSKQTNTSLNFKDHPVGASFWFSSATATLQKFQGNTLTRASSTQRVGKLVMFDQDCRLSHKQYNTSQWLILWITNRSHR